MLSNLELLINGFINSINIDKITYTILYVTYSIIFFPKTIIWIQTDLKFDFLNFFFLVYFYLFIFGCIGSSWLCAGFP